MPVDGASTSDGPGDPPEDELDAVADGEPAEPASNASVRQLSLNVVSSYASFGIGIVLSLVLTRVLLRHLGASTYGLWIVLLALVGYLGLLDIGVGTAAVQRVARLTAIGDEEGVADLIRTTWIFFAVFGRHGDRRDPRRWRRSSPRSSTSAPSARPRRVRPWSSSG